MEDLKAELIGAQRVAADEDGKVLVWTGRARTMSGADARHQRAPLSHTPLHLVEMILYSREALEGERQRVTVLGDGIMTLFGTPLAHEDHAMRACCAAISMQDAVPSAPGAAGV